MKEFFKNKRNITVLACLLAVVLAVTGVLIYRSTKPEVEDPGKTPEASENVSGEATTEENTADATEESATAEPSTEKQTESTTAKKETSTTVPNKKPENKPVTTTRPQQKPKPSQPSSDFVAKDPITGKPVPGLNEERYKLEMECIIMEYGSIDGYKKEVERIKNYKCEHCGKHDCPSCEYRKDAFGNTSILTFSSDKCPAIINHTAKCPYCGKPLATQADYEKNMDKYCNGVNCHLSFE